MTDAFLAWSGGKDSALALYRILQQPQYRVKYLLTTVNQAHQRITMHGVRLALLEAQAKAIGIPLKIVWVPENTPMATYDHCMAEALRDLKTTGITTGIFGDIFLQDLRLYRENRLAQIGLQAVFPLWGEKSVDLVQEFTAVGLKAKLVCVNDQRLGLAFLGQDIDQNFLDKLPPTVDPAGENGEYHSFVYAGPLFKYPIKFTPGQKIYRDYAPAEKNGKQRNTASLGHDTKFWFLDLLPPGNPASIF